MLGIRSHSLNTKHTVCKHWADSNDLEKLLLKESSCLVAQAHKQPYHSITDHMYKISSLYNFDIPHMSSINILAAGFLFGMLRPCQVIQFIS